MTGIRSFVLELLCLLLTLTLTSEVHLIGMGEGTCEVWNKSTPHCLSYLQCALLHYRRMMLYSTPIMAD